MSKLKGKVAVVTGGARDIGRAVSLKLAKEGANVVINYFDNEDDAKETIRLIEEMGGKGIYVQGDATSLTDISNLVEKTKTAFGEKVDILVNVAGGLFARKTIDEIDVDFYNLIMDVNFKSAVFVTKAFVPLMGEGSAIVNFASQAGRDGGGPGAFLYAASKGAVSTFTRGLAKELGPKGIRVNAINPGMIATRFHDDFTKDQVRVNVANATALRREGRADEVADLVAYLASEESSFLSGNNIDINGGLAFS
ncbi:MULTISPECIES: SDR family NAD(P)-dependent oxidoreductase [Flavobacterium]|uniref:SDR family NAD(P)-dependent oxidoreductase n=1 Tax=Flavobacterium quisquiliarum TaxID=1834436 RepID=A0ABV8W6H9_9FLAO|nr:MULTISPECIES: SDR family oxidoreductase [Flavobacterium]MBW1654265.1 SDR family oxidoreductase [Flavobacterium quisquiliarum]NWL03308.1 oxidoreductase [Flavobacterium collinsii]